MFWGELASLLVARWVVCDEVGVYVAVGRLTECGRTKKARRLGRASLGVGVGAGYFVKKITRRTLYATRLP